MLQRRLLHEAEKDWRESLPHVLHPDTSKHFLDAMAQLRTKYSLGVETEHDKVLRFGGGTRSEGKGRTVHKVAMTMMGGSFLIAPMLIMDLPPGLVTSLITTSACIFAFGLVISIFLNAPFDVLSSTAAYPAALVVFIDKGGGSSMMHGVVVVGAFYISSFPFHFCWMGHVLQYDHGCGLVG